MTYARDRVELRCLHRMRPVFNAVDLILRRTASNWVTAVPLLTKLSPSKRKSLVELLSWLTMLRRMEKEVLEKNFARGGLRAMFYQ